jgi:hypothetical protein
LIGINGTPTVGKITLKASLKSFPMAEKKTQAYFEITVNMLLQGFCKVSLVGKRG